ncbi:hypothetical protein B0H14DRAFT_622200 [Mycena olivaceomarginata]|nr:hypothetical protein B0H14DRAFT_622200 [Mycena olivaceomarginata]
MLAPKPDPNPDNKLQRPKVFPKSPLGNRFLVRKYTWCGIPDNFGPFVSKFVPTFRRFKRRPSCLLSGSETTQFRPSGFFRNCSGVSASGASGTMPATSGLWSLDSMPTWSMESKLRISIVPCDPGATKEKPSRKKTWRQRMPNCIAKSRSVPSLLENVACHHHFPSRWRLIFSRSCWTDCGVQNFRSATMADGMKTPTSSRRDSQLADNRETGELPFSPTPRKVVSATPWVQNFRLILANAAERNKTTRDTTPIIVPIYKGYIAVVSCTFHIEFITASSMW